MSSADKRPGKPVGWRSSPSLALTAAWTKDGSPTEVRVDPRNDGLGSTAIYWRLWETYETAKVGQDGKADTDEAGNMLKVKKERPRLISELSPDIARLIEDVTVDRKGRAVPKFYSKL
jgi:hypothetical protein